MRKTPQPDNNSSAYPGGHNALASWQRPSSYWTVVVYHLPLAVVATVALVMPYAVALEKLPQLSCTFLHLTGYPCPFCGFTRAFWAISGGHWKTAFANSPLSYTVYLAAWAVFLWNSAALATGVVLSRGARLRFGAAHRQKALYGALLLLGANWIYRIFNGFDVV